MYAAHNVQSFINQEELAINLDAETGSRSGLDLFSKIGSGSVENNRIHKPGY